MNEQLLMKNHINLLNALISCNIPINVISDPYMKTFINGLACNYKLPSRNYLSERVLNEVLSKCYITRISKFQKETDLTICLDGWEDNSNNSIYAFMALKAQSEEVLDIVDLSGQRPTAENLKRQLLKSLQENAIPLSSVIALVTDSPSTMVRLRTDFQTENPHIFPIRCCLHHFNLIAKDISKLPFAKTIIKRNARLVSFFTSSHLWISRLRDWMKSQSGPKRYLRSLCETRW